MKNPFSMFMLDGFSIFKLYKRAVWYEKAKKIFSTSLLLDELHLHSENYFYLPSHLRENESSLEADIIIKKHLW